MALVSSRHCIIFIRSGSTSAVGLNLYASNATRGYVYANSSNDVGFLNNGGTWRLRVQVVIILRF